jgi:hypothetical protein
MMPKLILQLEDRVLKEYDLGMMVTIGRLPDNSVIIDNPAVSSHHACIFRDGDQFVVEDLQSTNGTFVNGKRVSRQALQQADTVLVGTHKLVLDQQAQAEAVTAEIGEHATTNSGDTMFLNAKSLLGTLVGSEVQRKHGALAARLLDVEAQASRARAATPAEPANAAFLRVLAGRADRSEYKLELNTCIIGKSKSSSVRLRGWFKPKMAVAITRNRQGYVATLLGGNMFINSQRVSGRRELKDGDLLEVSGLLMEFSMKQPVEA